MPLQELLLQRARPVLGAPRSVVQVMIPISIFLWGKGTHFQRPLCYLEPEGTAALMTIF